MPPPIGSSQLPKSKNEGECDMQCGAGTFFATLHAGYTDVWRGVDSSDSAEYPIRTASSKLVRKSSAWTVPIVQPIAIMTVAISEAVAEICADVPGPCRRRAAMAAARAPTVSPASAARAIAAAEATAAIESPGVPRGVSPSRQKMSAMAFGSVAGHVIQNDSPVPNVTGNAPVAAAARTDDDPAEAIARERSGEGPASANARRIAP